MKVNAKEMKIKQETAAFASVPEFFPAGTRKNIRRVRNIYVSFKREMVNAGGPERTVKTPIAAIMFAMGNE